MPLDLSLKLLLEMPFSTQLCSRVVWIGSKRLTNLRIQCSCAKLFNLDSRLVSLSMRLVPVSTHPLEGNNSFFSVSSASPRPHPFCFKDRFEWEAATEQHANFTPRFACHTKLSKMHCSWPGQRCWNMNVFEKKGYCAFFAWKIWMDQRYFLVATCLFKLKCPSSTVLSDYLSANKVFLSKVQMCYSCTILWIPWYITQIGHRD